MKLIDTDIFRLTVVNLPLTREDHEEINRWTALADREFAASVAAAQRAERELQDIEAATAGR
jgi:hypothetical protein